MYNRYIPEISVSNFKQCYHFYTSYLGFKDFSNVYKGQRALLYREEVQIALQAAGTAGSESRIPKPNEDWSSTSLTHNQTGTYLFRFDEIQSVLDALKEAGIELYEPPQTAWAASVEGSEVVGLFEFRVADPNGNILRFAQELRPSESFLSFDDRMEEVIPEDSLDLVPSSHDVQAKATELLLENLAPKLKTILHASFITYFDFKKTFRFEYDTSRHLISMFALLQRKHQLARTIKKVFGENIQIEIVSLTRQDESLGDIEQRGSVFDVPAAIDPLLNAHHQLEVQLCNLRFDVSELPHVQEERGIIKH